MLIVEDEPLVRMIAVDIVEEAGFEAVQAEDADGAVRILESRRDVQIVLTDIDLPGSRNGVELAVVIRERWPPIEILVTSGLYELASDELPQRCKFIPKPYKPWQIAATLRELTK